MDFVDWSMQETHCVATHPSGAWRRIRQACGDASVKRVATHPSARGDAFRQAEKRSYPNRMARLQW